MKKHLLLALGAIAVAAAFSACPNDLVPLPTIYTETLYERYVERFEPGNAAKGDPDETWLYDAGGALLEHSVYEFDAAFLTTGIRVYSSATVHDATTLLARFEFDYAVYDGEDKVVRGDLYVREGGVEVHTGYYTVAYNTLGNYTEFFEYETDGSGGWTVVEHRTCTYDVTDEYYVQERYFSDGTTDLASLTEQWDCVYDPAVAGRYVEETHTRIIAAAGGDTVGATPFVSVITHYFAWDADGRMFMQTDYVGGDRERAILYTFVPSGAGDVYPIDWRSAVDTNKKAVSVFNADGVLVNFTSYRYDADGQNIEKLVSNYSKVEGERAEVRETYAWTVDPEDAAMMFMDQRTYTYGYITRALKAGGVFAPTRLKSPAPAHLK